MNLRGASRFLLAVMIGVSTTGEVSVGQDATTRPTTRPTTRRKGPPVYTPRVLDAPKATVGGGSRGHAEGGPVVAVLAPDRLALATQEQPTLFWFISGSAKKPVRLTLVDEDQDLKPTVLRHEVPEAAAGIYALSLADHNVRLRPGAEYRFSVELILDADARSGNPVGQTILKRVDPPAELTAALKDAPAAEHAAVYADNGIWYDALAAISKQVEAGGAGREDRAALLEQVGLKEAAEADRAAAERATTRAALKK